MGIKSPICLTGSGGSSVVELADNINLIVKDAIIRAC